MAHDMDKLPPLPKEEELQVPVEFQDMMTGVDLSGQEAEMPPVDIEDLPLEAAPLPDFPEVVADVDDLPDAKIGEVELAEFPEQPSGQATGDSQELVEVMNRVANLLEELPFKLSAELAALTEIG